MSENQKIPEVLVLTSIEPEEHGDTLVSPALGKRIVEYRRSEGIMWNAFETAKSGSLQELSDARRLAAFYLLRNAAVVQDQPKSKLLSIERFNLSSTELYGLINPDEARNVAGEDYLEINAGMPHSYAAEVYRDASKNAKRLSSDAELDVSTFLPIKEEMLKRFSVISEIVDELPEGVFEAAAVRHIFEKAITKLGEREADWREWKVTNPAKKKMLTVVAVDKEIHVPDGRGPVESKTKLFGLLLHEIGVHAQRAVNGYKTGDDLMAFNMPEYLDFEEGLGSFMEYLITGEVPDKNKDRYIDIALASGAIDGIRLSRDQLIELGISREKARAAARGKETPSEAVLLKQVHDHVNRIFRGGDGQPVRDNEGKIIDQSVFTKDLVYHEGFVKARNFIAAKLQEGYSAVQILDYLLSGKFSAADDSHVTYLRDKHGIVL